MNLHPALKPQVYTGVTVERTHSGEFGGVRLRFPTDAPAVRDRSWMATLGPGDLGWSAFLFHPRRITPEDRDRLLEACHVGGTTVHGSGLNPGNISGVLPLVLSGMSRRGAAHRHRGVVDRRRRVPRAVAEAAGWLDTDHRRRPLDADPLLLPGEFRPSRGEPGKGELC
ncbi:hypothetical protein NRB20_40620 [Nocardia sp. RB20]|uniref:Uncharacterized protein n=1 Tax=Nocardia macrotermitis TaxID=2585198 RepID=A0A7K0D5D6_9NOCA|nr:hypothetical protein [Nocardia macrotermitis]